MIGFSVNQAKGMFFDRRPVLDATERATKRVLSKFGAFVRQRDISSQRRRKAVSDPGSPPSAHSGLLKRFTYFGYDQSRRSVVIGPTKLNIVYFQGDGQPTTGLVTEVLEYGGTIRIFEVQRRDGSWRRADLRSRRRIAAISDSMKRMRTIQIAARPHTKPAFQAELSKAAGMWQDQIKAA